MQTFLSSLAVMVLLSAVVYAATPDKVSYQGFLTDGVGDPVANGSYSVNFTIYDAASGGTALWSETQSVSTADGLFSVWLGAVTPIAGTVFADSGRYLGIAVESDPEIVPRTEFVAVPYAYRVESVDGAKGGTVSGDLEVTGRASIGTGHGTLGSEAFVAGRLNTASGFRSTVSGGSGNDATGGNSAIGGGSANEASGDRSAVGGGHANTASGDTSVVSGGSRNTASGLHSAIAGGKHNVAAGDFSLTAGYADTLTSDADYSVLFGIDSDLTQDSTFMVDMPHVRVGDESTGYELPTVDGTSGQVLATDGNGQADWADAATGDISSVTAGTGLSGGGASGDVTLDIATDGVTSTEIADATIVDDDISAGAAINISKIEGTAMNLSDAQTVSGTKTFDDLNIATTTRYLTLSHASFVPRFEDIVFDRTIGYLYSTGGATPAASFYTTPELPHGATLVSVEALVQDNAGGHDISFDLIKRSIVNGAGGTIASASTSGISAGYQTISDNTIADDLIDNDNYYYYLAVAWTQPPTPSDIKFFAIKITYTISEPLP